MSGSENFSIIAVTDGLYQILIREAVVPLTDISNRIGMLWEWFVTPHWLE